MARRKTVRRTTKRTTSSRNSSPTVRIEKDFLKTPSKLNALFSKDVKTLKQKENRLKSASNKLKAKLKTSQNRLKTAGKNKNATGGKKLFITAKKSHHVNLQLQSSLNKQLDDVTKALSTASNKQAKFTALRKHLSQFEKDWTNDSKKLKAKSKTKSKAKKSSVRKTKISKPPQLERQQQQQEPYESQREDVRLDETSEITS